jgi:hypothetical protein
MHHQYNRRDWLTTSAAVNVWRNRTQGPALIGHPTKVGAKVLHVRKPDGKAGDGVVWNFPLGRKGRLTLKILLHKGFGGAHLSLADRFIRPTDAAGEKKVHFALLINADGQLSVGAKLQPARWQALGLAWDLEQGRCDVLVDGQPAAVLPLLHKATSGASYLRLRSAAKSTDPAGFLIESVAAILGKDAVDK